MFRRILRVQKLNICLCLVSIFQGFMYLYNKSLFFVIYLLTHSWRDLFRVFDIGFRQVGDISGIILVKEFFKKSNKKLNHGNFHEETIHSV